ncbi:MAG: V-type ATPase 116kDa subunit family protein [Chlamydiia bacterium]
MIIPCEKLLFIGTSVDLVKFLENAQKIGQLQFQSIEGKKMQAISSAAEDTLHAIRILKHQVPVDQLQNDVVPRYELVEKIIYLQDRLDRVVEAKRVLAIEIARIKPFGQVDLETIQELAKRTQYVVQFFSKKQKAILSREVLEKLIFVSTDATIEYFVYVGNAPIKDPALTEMQMEYSLDTLKERFQNLQKEELRIEAELKEMAHYQEILEDHLAEILDHDDLRHARSLAANILGPSLFAVECWVPANKTEWKEALNGLNIHVEHVRIKDEETPPTYVENQGFSRIGEDLMGIYDVPSIKDKDPSLYVLIFFALFFAIIVADAGYGFILLAIALVGKYLARKVTGTIQRFLRLLLILSTSCIIWGALTASYFSIKLPPDHFLTKASMIYQIAKVKVQYQIDTQGKSFKEWTHQYPHLATQNDPEVFLQGGGKVVDGKVTYALMEDLFFAILFEFALTVGVLHIILSMLRGMRENLSRLGWIVFIIGAYLYCPTYLKTQTIINEFGIISSETASIIGLQFIGIGVAFAIIVAIFKRGVMGIFEVTQAIQVFADVLSYVRLYALGLAGILLAATFNTLAADLGYALGLFVLLVGHGLNFLIALMGGTIHGLRLNFLEWYHYCFEGGGKLFSPLIKRRISL